MLEQIPEYIGGGGIRVAWSKVYFTTLLLQSYETLVKQKIQAIIPDVQICVTVRQK